MRYRLVLAAACFTLLSGRPAVVAADTTTTQLEGVEESVFELRPELRWTGDRGAFAVTGQLRSTEAGVWLLDPRVTGVTRRSLREGVNGLLSLDAGTKRWTGLGQTARVQSIASLLAGTSRQAVWAGAGAARLRSAGQWSTSGVYHAGATVQFGRSRLSLLTQASSYKVDFTSIDTIFIVVDSLPPYIQETSGRRTESYADTGLEFLWQGERIGLGMDFNVRLGRRLKEPRSSAVAHGTYRLTPRVTLQARGGRNPSIPDQGIPSHNFATMAFQLDLQSPSERSYPLHGVLDEPVRPSFSLETLGGDRRRIRIRLGGAESVEIAGDFSDWNAIPLEKRGFDSWEVEARIAPGTRRTNIRIDGGPWISPPGLQRIEDEFNGVVGLFIAP